MFPLIASSVTTDAAVRDLDPKAMMLVTRQQGKFSKSLCVVGNGLRRV
jgi:hypothetical protein